MVDLELKKQNITGFINESCGTTECAVDCDFTLPDYLPEIRKILKCCAVPGISSVAVVGSRITGEGSLLLKVIYESETGGISAYEQSVSLTGYIDVKDIENAVFSDCKASVGYMNCRPTTSRRVTVHGAVTLSFMIRKRAEQCIVTDELPAEIEKKCISCNPACVMADAGRYFALTEVVSLGGRPPISTILRATAHAMVNELKVIRDKALVKGELRVSITYFSGESLEHFDTKLNISQIVDAIGLMEDEIIDTELRVTALNVVPKEDGTGETTLLDISSKLLAALHAYKETDVKAITDAYSTDYDVDLSFKNVDILNYREQICDTFSIRERLDLPMGECNKVIDSWYDSLKADYRIRNGELEICGSINLNILTVSKDNEPCIFERNIDYLYAVPIEGGDDFFVNPVVAVTSSSVAKSADFVYEAAIELHIRAEVFEKRTLSLVDDIVPSSDKCESVDEDTAVVLYFAAENESVWDIARKYNSTVTAVMTENELCEEVIREDKMLLIPR